MPRSTTPKGGFRGNNKIALGFRKLRSAVKASLAISEYFHNNKIFDAGSRDNCNQRFRELKELLGLQGIILNTEDINPLDSTSKIHIHIDADPHKLNRSKKSGAYSILVVSESPIICPANQNSETRKLADKIFTWENRYEIRYSRF